MALLMFLLVSTIYFVTGHHGLSQNIDTQATALGAWNLGTRGSVALPESWPAEAVSWSVEGSDGGLYVNRFPGAMVWGAPFYFVHGLFADQAGAFDHPYFVDYRPAAVAAATATGGGIALGFLLYRRFTDRWTALGASGVLAFATSAWSISGTALWTHSVTQLALTAGMLAMARTQPTAGGLAFGFAVFTRPQTAVIPAIVGIWGGVRRRHVGPVVAVGLASGLGLGALALYSWMYFGTWLPIAGYGDYGVRNLVGTSLGVQTGRILPSLIDPTRGLFFYSPFLVILLPGLRSAWRDAPDWVKSSALAGVAYFLLQLRLNGYSGGSTFFAYRLPLEMLVLSAPLLVLSFENFVVRGQIRQLLFASTVAVAIGLQVTGVTWLSSEAMRLPTLTPRVEGLCSSSEYDCEPEDLLSSSARSDVYTESDRTELSERGAGWAG